MQGSNALILSLKKWAKKNNKRFITETATGRHISYADFLVSLKAIQVYLGNTPQKILVVLPGGIDTALLWIASLTSGHTLYPTSPYLTTHEYQEVLAQVQPDLIVADTTVQLPPTHVQQITPQLLKEKTATRTAPQLQSKEGYVFLSTSGSTGKPKGILLNATKIVITANAIRQVHELDENDKGLTPLPFYHVNAPVVSLIASLLAGAEVIIAPKYSTSHFWDWVEKFQPTWISIVPTMIAMLLSTNPPKTLEKIPLRFIRTASAPLPAANLLAFEEKFGIPVIETYGITEAAATIAANPLPPKKHKPGSVGRPIGATMRICNTNSTDALPAGTTGEVCIAGDNVISYYVGNVDTKSFTNGWFRTGDLGFMDADGYVYLTGRIKDIIIRGGENISPREIEDVLIGFPGIREVVVVGQP